MSYSEEIMSIFEDVELLNRLKNIKQLGSASLIFEKGNHSRYEHSVGALKICEQKINTIKFNSTEKNQLSEKKIKSILVYSLLHDIGHMALSHEMEAIIGVHHEFLSKIILETDEITAKIKKMGIQQEFQETCNDLRSQTYVMDILDSPIDCDRFDYLVRDSKSCLDSLYLPLENSVNKIISSMRIIDYKGMKRVAIQEEVIEDVLFLIKSRMELHDKVYSSPESIALRMIIKLFLNNNANKRQDIISNFVKSIKTPLFKTEILKFHDERVYDWISSMDPIKDFSFHPKEIMESNLRKKINFKYVDNEDIYLENEQTYSLTGKNESEYYYSDTIIALDKYLSNLKYNDIIVGDIKGDFGWSVDLKKESFGGYIKKIKRTVSIY